MHYSGWKSELTRFALIVVSATLLGLLLGLGLWLGLIAALGYGIWNIQSLNRFHRWLQSRLEEDPPESTGLWGRVLDLVYQQQKEELKERQRLQSTVDYLRASFGSIGDAVVLLDPAGHIEWSNNAAALLLGLRHPEDDGRLLINLVRHPHFIRYFEREDYAHPLDTVSPVNNKIHLSVTITYFGQGSRLLFARDVTTTMRLEQMRKDFVANVSHELRTPLTVISGYLETFAEHTEADSRWRRPIEQMQEQSRRMQGLINDLMMLSRLESLPNSKEQEIIQLRPFMEMIREEALVAAKGERHISIDCDDSLALKGTVNELRSAFSNLAVNAAKYTEPGGKIQLRWYADSGFAYFEVADDGVGIAPQHIPRLTERFYRVDESRSGDTGGTGLGLAIVKHVLLRHHAELQIRSEPGQGSSFRCVFPLASVQRR